jgi:hypothetical protein
MRNFRAVPAVVFGLLASVSAVPAVAAGISIMEVTSQTSDLSGGAAVKSRYVLADLLVATEQPVFQAWASFPAGENCSVDIWASHGFTTNAGAELDLGGSCHIELDRLTDLEVSVSRYVLHGSEDMVDVTAKVTRGPVDVALTSYSWRNNQDAIRVEAGYTFVPIEKLEVRLLGLYVAGVEASYQLTEKLSLEVTGYLPIKKGRSDTRGTEVVAGLSLTF